jgi:hypothetical protein
METMRHEAGARDSLTMARFNLRRRSTHRDEAVYWSLTRQRDLVGLGVGPSL